MLLRDRILKAAIRLSRAHGFRGYARSEVISLAGVAAGSVNYHFDSLDGLRDAVIQHAIEKEDLKLIAQGLVDKHPLVQTISEDLKRRAAQCLTQ